MLKIPILPKTTWETNSSATVSEFHSEDVHRVDRQHWFDCSMWPEATDEKRVYYTTFLKALTNLSWTSLGDIAPFADDPKVPHKDLRTIALSVINRCHVLTDCDWKGEEFPGGCCPLFRPVFTENGFCYTFNSRFSENNIPW